VGPEPCLYRLGVPLHGLGGAPGRFDRDHRPHDVEAAHRRGQLIQGHDTAVVPTPSLGRRHEALPAAEVDIGPPGPGLDKRDAELIGEGFDAILAGARPAPAQIDHAASQLYAERPTTDPVASLQNQDGPIRLGNHPSRRQSR
jgi:hypothetical protein